MKKEILGSWWNQREQGGCFHGLHESQVSWNTTAIRHPLPGTKPAAWWGWILLFICAVWQKCKKFFISGERGEPPKCTAGDGMLRASSHIFWGWGKCFGVIMMFSLLCSLLREPLGMMWDFEERAGKSPPSFTHSVTCDRFMPAALLGFICSLNFISPLWVFILLRDCQGSC